MAKPVLHPDHDYHEQHVVQRVGEDPVGRIVPAQPYDELAEQPDLRQRGVAGLVDELPDDAGPDERDRHGHEDQGLVDGLALHTVDQQRPSTGPGDVRQQGARR